jgi:hypothetical protein
LLCPFPKNQHVVPVKGDPGPIEILIQTFHLFCECERRAAESGPWPVASHRHPADGRKQNSAEHTHKCWLVRITVIGAVAIEVDHP